MLGTFELRSEIQGRALQVDRWPNVIGQQWERVLLMEHKEGPSGSTRMGKAGSGAQNKWKMERKAGGQVR